MKDEKELRKCDFCLKEYDDSITDVNVYEIEGQTKWKCQYCKHKEFTDKYKLINEIHNSEQTALIVEDYPYGFKRTKIRYWIETTKRGDRFVSQTLNPKTDLWNKPKKSTYSDVMILIRNKENNHIKYHSWGVEYSVLTSLNLFLDFTKDYIFNELQQKKIKIGKAIYKTREHISFEIREQPLNETEQEKQERKTKQDKVKQDIMKIHNFYLSQEGEE